MNEPRFQKMDSEYNTFPKGNNADNSVAADRRGVERQFLEYYGLNEQPFGVTPDLRFLYLGPKHRQALDALNFGTELNRGFLTLIAKPGMGKTSLLFNYLEGLRDRARTVFLFQTDGDSTELMRYLLADLGIESHAMELPEMRAVLSQILMTEMKMGRRFVLVIDEAQNLSEKVLESVRLLSNFETPWTKLMQIVLAGQPQLAEKLAKPAMAQLQQRVSFSIRIEPLTRQEIDVYIDHRLWVAGYTGPDLFTVGARELLAERSQGIPRNINNMCFCAMSFAWALKEKAIGREMMSDVLADVESAAQEDAAPRVEPVSPVQIAEKKAVELTPNFIEAPKPRVPDDVPSIGFVMEEPLPQRSWTPKVVVASLILTILVWCGSQFNVGQWVGPSFHSFAATLKSVIDPTPAPPVENPSTTSVPVGPTEEQRTGVPRRAKVDPSKSQIKRDEN